MTQTPYPQYVTPSNLRAACIRDSMIEREDEHDSDALPSYVTPSYLRAACA